MIHSNPLPHLLQQLSPLPHLLQQLREIWYLSYFSLVFKMHLTYLPAYLSIFFGLNLWQESDLVGLRMPSWNRQPAAPRPPPPPPPPRRESSRIKNMFQIVPINPQPLVFIDLTTRSIAAGDKRGKVVGLTPRTPQVADSGAVATSSTAAKGKRMEHSIEKRITNYGVKAEKEKARMEALIFFLHAFYFF